MPCNAGSMRHEFFTHGGKLCREPRGLATFLAFDPLGFKGHTVFLAFIFVSSSVGGFLMNETLGVRLRNARINSGLSQNDAATIMHVTRQSFSKWENDRGYPDIDNLVYLSQLYEVSIDDLLADNADLKSKIGANDSLLNEKMNKLKRVNKELFQNRDEGLFLMILSLVSAIVPPIGIFVPIYVMWRNSKYNSLYKIIYLVSMVVIIISIWGTGIIVSDNFLPTETHVYRID